MWIKRELKPRIIKATQSRPTVLLTGARQTGKSSLLKNIFPNTHYISFDHLQQVEQVKESPKHFLNQFESPVILDEVQYVPELFRELKIVIDENRQEYGKWILTGSQQFELMENISETLAGRISIIHLETLSASELRKSNIPHIKEFLWKGGYPEIWSNELLETNDFFESYIRTYIERDLRRIVEVKNLNDFRRLLKVLATRVGQLLNYRDISKDVGVSDMTIKTWIHALQTSGLIYLLSPFYTNIGKRLTKSPKIYFADHGLAAYLLGIETMHEWNNHIYRGNLWENFVMMELIKTHFLTPGKDIFFYRDQNGVEIDFMIEKKRKLFFIEAKATETVNKKKLNFGKVIPLFEEKYETEAIVAQNIPDKKILRLGGYNSFNPLNVVYELK